MQALVSDGKLFHCSVFRVQKKAHPKLKSKPSEAGLVGRGGARERAQFSPYTETGLSGLCDDDMGVHPAGQALPGRGQHPPAAGAAHSRSANAYGSSRHSGMDMHRGPPRPRESSALGMVWSRMPASSRARLVT